MAYLYQTTNFYKTEKNRVLILQEIHKRLKTTAQLVNRNSCFSFIINSDVFWLLSGHPLLLLCWRPNQSTCYFQIVLTFLCEEHHDYQKQPLGWLAANIISWNKVIIDPFEQGIVLNVVHIIFSEKFRHPYFCLFQWPHLSLN